MFCSNCGKELDSDAKFCSKCGYDLNKKADFNKTNYLFIKICNIIRLWLGITIILAGGIIAGNPIAILFGGIILPIRIKYMNKTMRFIIGFILFVCMVCLNDVYDNDTMPTITNTTTSQPKIIMKKEQQPETQQANSIKTIDDNNIVKQDISIINKVKKENKVNVENNKKQIASTLDKVKKEDKVNVENNKRQDSSILSSDKIPPLPKKIDVKINTSGNKTTASYSPSAIWTVPTQRGKGYDKVIDKYGVSGVKKINKLLPQAAEIISKSPECDELSYVSYSDRGTPSNIVIFGGCNNNARFYLNEKDIKNKISITSNKSKFEQMKYQLEDACNEIIKSRLKHPQTFDKSFARSNTYIGVNNIKITVGFTAKNSFGMKLKHTAVCFFNEKPELIEFTITEDK